MVKNLNIPYEDKEFDTLEKWRATKGQHKESWHDFLLRQAEDGR